MDADGAFLALEFVHGRSASALEKAWRQRAEHLPVAVALWILRDVAEALTYAHEAPNGVAGGVVHRDVSPDNVLVSYEGESKLTDFGPARHAGDEFAFTPDGDEKRRLMAKQLGIDPDQKPSAPFGGNGW